MWLVAKMAIHVRRAVSCFDFEWIRKTRNYNRQFMTGDNRLITWLEQAIFMYKALCSDLDIYICEIMGASGSIRIGFLLLRKSSLETSRFELTICIAKPFWNLGYGKQLLKWACFLSLPLKSLIYANNSRSISIHESCGFSYCGQADASKDVLLFLYDPK
jgi:RimJ/RimL family protein N-acetyltransferase